MQIKDILGKWNIQEMKMWDDDYIHMETQAYIQFKENKTGEFQFGLVTGYFNGDLYKIGDQERFEFTWEGNDEYDQVFGFGWVQRVSKGRLEGEIRFHSGDKSKFSAVNATYIKGIEVFDINDQDERIASIIQDNSLSVNSKTLNRYLAFLKENISLPYKVTGTDSYFTSYRPQVKKRNSLKGFDKFEIIAFEDVEGCSNLFVKANRLGSEGGTFSLQLFELEGVSKTTIETKILEDYSYWISHYM